MLGPDRSTSRPARVYGPLLAVACTFACRAALADPPPAHGLDHPSTSPSGSTAATAAPREADTTDASARAATLPPLNIRYLQYGVAFTGEFVAAPGNICKGSSQSQPCIFGSGGGVAIRVGYRAAGPWYLGAAYELSKQDPNQLYRLGIMQQLRGEARYYVPTGWDASPYVSAGAGVAVYGNEGAIDTIAPEAYAAVGGEAQLSRRMVVGLALAYRVLYFTAFTDSSSTFREAGLAHVVGLDLSLEARDPL